MSFHTVKPGDGTLYKIPRALQCSVFRAEEKNIVKTLIAIITFSCSVTCLLALQLWVLTFWFNQCTCGSGPSCFITLKGIPITARTAHHTVSTTGIQITYFKGKGQYFCVEIQLLGNRLFPATFPESCSACSLRRCTQTGTLLWVSCNVGSLHLRLRACLICFYLHCVRQKAHSAQVKRLREKCKSKAQGCVCMCVTVLLPLCARVCPFCVCVCIVCTNVLSINTIGRLLLPFTLRSATFTTNRIYLRKTKSRNVFPKILCHT